MKGWIKVPHDRINNIDFSKKISKFELECYLQHLSYTGQFNLREVSRKCGWAKSSVWDVVRNCEELQGLVECRQRQKALRGQTPDKPRTLPGQNSNLSYENYEENSNDSGHFPDTSRTDSGQTEDLTILLYKEQEQEIRREGEPPLIFGEDEEELWEEEERKEDKKEEELNAPAPAFESEKSEKRQYAILDGLDDASRLAGGVWLDQDDHRALVAEFGILAIHQATQVLRDRKLKGELKHASDLEALRLFVIPASVPQTLPSPPVRTREPSTQDFLDFRKSLLESRGGAYVS